MKLKTVQDRVQNGIDLLNRRLPPGWECRINLDELDLSNSDYCVLGQVFSKEAEEFEKKHHRHQTGYYYGCDTLRLDHPERYGFLDDYSHVNAITFDELNEEWMCRLTELQIEHCNDESSLA